jgi:ribose transport system permease protein
LRNRLFDFDVENVLPQMNLHFCREIFFSSHFAASLFHNDRLVYAEAAAGALGGTSLFGGLGSVVGCIRGALMIGLINNGLILMGLEFSQQLIARGATIPLAITIARSRK